MSGQVHRIRLRDPWQLSTANTSSEPDDPCLVARRVFQCPTGLSATTHVTLVLDQLPPPTRVSVNGRTPPSDGQPGASGRVPITDCLQTRNLLQLEFPATLSAADRDALGVALASGAVRLEIEDSTD